MFQKQMAIFLAILVTHCDSKIEYQTFKKQRSSLPFHATLAASKSPFFFPITHWYPVDLVKSKFEFQIRLQFAPQASDCKWTSAGWWLNSLKSKYGYDGMIRLKKKRFDDDSWFMMKELIQLLHTAYWPCNFYPSQILSQIDNYISPVTIRD